MKFYLYLRMIWGMLTTVHIFFGSLLKFLYRGAPIVFPWQYLDKYQLEQ